MMNSLIWAIKGTSFTFLMTALGSAMVFIFRKNLNMNINRIFLGFAAGVMIAASVWSLIIPSIEMSENLGYIGWVPATGGFILGVLFLLALDNILPHIHPDLAGGKDTVEGVSSSFKRNTLLMSAVTLHNIPEGMAVGLAFALGAQQGGEGAFAPAIALALGMGIQNFPEGAAISLPLRQEGMSTSKSFFMGAMSGFVEPVFGVLTVIIAGSVTPVMPWLLSFAAGAMMYVVVEELIPEAHLGEHSNTGTMGVMIGFIIMMILDVALG